MLPQAAPDLEQRLFKLQAQLDRLSLALQQWQQTQENLHPMELRLAQLMQQSGEVLERLTATDERHAQAVGEVESRLAAETRLQQDVYQGIREVERTIQEEWSALREQVSHDLQAVISELRVAGEPRPAALTAGAGTWPLESVLQLHDELRQSGEGQASPSAAAADGPAPAPARVVPQLPAASEALAGRIDSLEHAVAVEKEELAQAADRSERQGRTWARAFAALVLALIGAGAFVVWQQWQVQTRLNQAAARAAAAERQAAKATEAANRTVAETRENADRQIAAARETAQQAQVVSAVLAAPDLIRFNATGATTAPRAYAQMLWSRSRGLVFSASRVPVAPGHGTYQIWLLTTGSPVSAGLFVPDSGGRVTLVTDEPPKVPRAVVGVSVTLEPQGGSQVPSNPPVLARVSNQTAESKAQ